MSNDNFELEQEKIYSALEYLEQVILDKLHETSVSSTMLKASENDERSIKATNIQQANIIHNLNTELNRLQKAVAQLTEENESLSSQNESLLKKINKLRSDSENVIDNIENDLIKISKLITK